MPWYHFLTLAALAFIAGTSVSWTIRGVIEHRRRRAVLLEQALRMHEESIQFLAASRMFLEAGAAERAKYALDEAIDVTRAHERDLHYEATK